MTKTDQLVIKIITEEVSNEFGYVDPIKKEKEARNYEFTVPRQIVWYLSLVYCSFSNATSLAKYFNTSQSNMLYARNKILELKSSGNASFTINRIQNKIESRMKEDLENE